MDAPTHQQHYTAALATYDDVRRFYDALKDVCRTHSHPSGATDGVELWHRDPQTQELRRTHSAEDLLACTRSSASGLGRLLHNKTLYNLYWRMLDKSTASYKATCKLHTPFTLVGSPRCILSAQYYMPSRWASFRAPPEYCIHILPGPDQDPVELSGGNSSHKQAPTPLGPDSFSAPAPPPLPLSEVEVDF